MLDQEKINAEIIREMKTEIEKLRGQIIDEKLNLVAEMKKQKMFFSMLRNDAYTHREKHRVCDLATKVINQNILDATDEIKFSLIFDPDSLLF